MARLKAKHKRIGYAALIVTGIVVPLLDSFREYYQIKQRSKAAISKHTNTVIKTIERDTNLLQGELNALERAVTRLDQRIRQLEAKKR